MSMFIDKRILHLGGYTPVSFCFYSTFRSWNLGHIFAVNAMIKTLLQSLGRLKL